MSSVAEEFIVREEVEACFGRRLLSARPLQGGMIGEVYRVELEDGTPLVAKLDRMGGAHLGREGYMLEYLRDHSNLPVPEVFHSSDALLVMEFVEGQSTFSDGAERHAAELLAGLHGVTADAYGQERDTLIGSLSQPNPWTESWVEFFRERRLLYMADVACESGRLPLAVRRRLDVLAGRLEEYLREPDRPSLIHGDAWSQNVLARGDRVTAFIDPAIYHADPEMELAYISLFNSFGESFFRAYDESRPIPDDFFEVRREVYGLYPLLVHVHFFGGGYVEMVSRSLEMLGV